MKALERRLSDLEQQSPGPTRWHRVIVDGQSEEQALADYEAANGPVGGDACWIIRFMVAPTALTDS